MDNAFQIFWSWQFALFCLSLAAVNEVIKRIAEYILDNPKVPASKDSRIWTELILPISPVVLGGLGAIIAKQYPYPDDIKSASSRFAFGMVAGLLSGLFYRIVKPFLASKAGINLPDDSAAEANAAQVKDTINKN